MFEPLKFTNPFFWILTIAGLGIFLFGIHSISNVLKKLASTKLSKIINKCSSNPILGLLTGAGFTAVIQSSSATSSLTIGLVRAGVMTFLQAAAIIIGANIGTTITSFIVSIPFAEYFALFIFIGALILLLTTKRKATNFGELFFALGCIFFGLTLMSTNLKSLAAEQWFQDLLIGLDQMPWLGLLLGAVLTVCLQSSSAVIGVAQGLYVASVVTSGGSPEGLITLFGIIPIILGSNIGTTSTALIACIGGSKDSKKVALFHVLFNVLGALLFMGVLYAARTPLESINAASEIDPKLQISLVHLVFNLATAIIFLPLLKPICKLINLIIKDKDSRPKLNIVIKELDNKFIKQFPSEGISLAKTQVIAMFKYSLEMFKTIGIYLENQAVDDFQYVNDIEKSINIIDRQLNDYLMAADKGELSPEDMRQFTHILRACKDIERIGDYGQNLINFYCPDIDKKPALKESKNYELFNEINNKAVQFIEETLNIYEKSDSQLALKVIKDRRDEISLLDKEINKHFESISTLNIEKSNYLDYVFIDILNSYQRVFSHCSNIAKLFGNDKVYIYSSKEEEHFDKMKDRY